MAGEISLKLNQEESNLVLRALETLEETCVAAVEPEACLALQRLWGRVFDAGGEAGCGGEGQGEQRVSLLAAAYRAEKEEK